MRKYVAELAGTMILVIFGCGSAVAANKLVADMALPQPFGFTTLTVAVAFGLAFIAVSYCIGTISGCHINPAVSLATFITGKLNNRDFVGYIVAQCIGAILGSLFLWLLFGSKVKLGANGFGESSPLYITGGIALILELVLTFVFVLVVLRVTSKKENASFSGVIIGITLMLVHIMGIPFTGTSVNPARSLGPALITGETSLAQVWVFIVAPLLGAVAAAFAYRALEKSERV